MHEGRSGRCSNKYYDSFVSLHTSQMIFTAHFKPHKGLFKIEILNTNSLLQLSRPSRDVWDYILTIHGLY